MSLSQNIRRLRHAKGLKQEELAGALGVSAQAVSKWETGQTYPDGALLVPLADRLGVSLDELFDHDMVSMPDVSRRMIRLIQETPKQERFDLIRDLCWQIQRALAGPRASTDLLYDPNDLLGRTLPSWIVENEGFTLISNGEAPFFSAFDAPEEGLETLLADTETVQAIFAAMSRKNTLTVLTYLFRQPPDYIFDAAVLERECGLCPQSLPDVIRDLLTLHIVGERALTINGEGRTVYALKPAHLLVALLLVAEQVGYVGPRCMSSYQRKHPFLP